MRRFIILIMVLVLAFAGLKSYYDFLLSPVDRGNTEKKLFMITPGKATVDIAQSLEKEGLIRSANAFTVLVKRTDNVGKIQAGNFKLSSSMSAAEILGELKSGVIDKKVTLLEGWRVEEMGEKLSAELGIKSTEFVKQAKEGYMFPDTYLFSPEATVSEVVQTMRANFDKRYDTMLQNKIKAQGLTPEQGVILASIVEREARSDEVRRMVASILLKRYKIDMALNADATVQYILGYQKKDGSWWKRHLTKDDLKTPSSYNTYLYAGLPPAPIANPSASSLRAVAEASTTPYLYYYHDSKGRSYYARTLDEHNENVASYP